MPVSTDKDGQDPEQPYDGREETYHRDEEAALAKDPRIQDRR